MARMNLSESDKQRFHSKVAKSDGDGCWMWIGTLRKRGKIPQGGFSVKSVFFAVHRVAYEIYYGVIPSGSIVLRRCGQPLCVRPDHLYVGSLMDRTHRVEDWKVRFWRFVEKSDGCWNWVGGTYKCTNGPYESPYGLFGREGKSYRAHRVSWEMEHGPIPTGMCVLHHCDNPRCVNPDHLFLGTRTDNADDKVSKGRQAKGEDYGITPAGVRGGRKLSAANVLEIRIAHARGGISRRALGESFGVTEGAVRGIIEGKTWKHL